MSAQQISVLQETDKEMWKTILSYGTTTFTNINNNDTSFIRILILLVLDLVVCLL